MVVCGLGVTTVLDNWEMELWSIAMCPQESETGLIGLRFLPVPITVSDSRKMELYGLGVTTRLASLEMEHLFEERNRHLLFRHFLLLRSRLLRLYHQSLIKLLFRIRIQERFYLL